MNRGIPALAVLLGVLILLGPLSLVGYAGGEVTISFKPEAEVFNATVMAVVFNGTVNIAGNATYTINVSLPNGWNLSDVAAVHVYAWDVSSEITLTAKDSGGATLASGSIVPLSTEYHTVLPPGTVTIELAASNAAKATIVVFVQSQPVQFKVSLNETSVTLKVGQTAWVHGVLKQIGGPSGWVYGLISTTSPLVANAYWGTYNTGDIVSQAKSVNNPIDTTGADWSQPFSIHIDTTYMTDKDAGQYTVTLKFYYDYIFESPATSQNAKLVATVTLAGNLLDDVLKLGESDIDYRSLGVGIAAVLVIGILFLGARTSRGRRGSASPAVLLILVLLLLAGLGFALGLMDFDLKTKYEIDPAMLGVGMLAALALLLMVKAGYVRVPRFRIFKR